MDVNEYMDLQKEAGITVLSRKGECLSLHDVLAGSGMDMEQFCDVLVHLAKNEVVAILLNHLSGNAHTYKKNSEYICARFFEMLARYYSRERSVSFYASKLCISTKYLATVVKKVSGKTPVAWIKERVVSEIEHMLLYSQASVKEIACQLHFPSVSALGKIFKANKGISPVNYRKQYAGITSSALQ